MVSVPVKLLVREIAQVYGVQSFEKWNLYKEMGLKKKMRLGLYSSLIISDFSSDSIGKFLLPDRNSSPKEVKMLWGCSGFRRSHGLSRYDGRLLEITQPPS